MQNHVSNCGPGAMQTNKQNAADEFARFFFLSSLVREGVKVYLYMHNTIFNGDLERESEGKRLVKHTREKRNRQNLFKYANVVYA